jgi:radical SAM protein with 4Fe4S-binding SPASM domain
MNKNNKFMSKQISLFFIVEDSVITCQRLTAVLEKCCEAGHDTYHIEFTFKDVDVNNLFIEKIIEVARTLKERFKFKADYTLACRYEQLRGLSLRGLAKKGFNIKLLLDGVAQLRTVSKPAKHVVRFLPKAEIFVNNLVVCEPVSISNLTCDIEIPLRFDCINGIESNFMNLFSDWLFSKSAVEIKNFTDLLKLMLMKERNGCEYNSCLGHVLSVDSSGIVYWCKHNRPETVLGHIDEFKTLSDIFNRGQFEMYLDMHYQKREHCKSACSRYEICQGGCPLNCDTSQKEKCTEQNFIEVIDHLSDELRRGIDLGDLSLLNKHARTVILNAIAFAPFSDFFQNLEDQNKKEEPITSIKTGKTCEAVRVGKINF